MRTVEEVTAYLKIQLNTLLAEWDNPNNMAAVSEDWKEGLQRAYEETLEFINSEVKPDEYANS